MPPRPVCKYQAEAAASDKRCSLTHLLTASRHNRLGICFSGAGFGAAYQLGAAHVLQTLGILSADTPVSGEQDSLNTLSMRQTKCTPAPAQTICSLLHSLIGAAGASAGSIVAVASRCSLRQLDVLNALNAVAQVRLETSSVAACIGASGVSVLPFTCEGVCS